MYMSGFNNEFSTEALPGALPAYGNNPQKCPYGLYAEQLSGTAFTVARVHNRRTWLYRIQPSVLHAPFVRCEGSENTGHGNLSNEAVYAVDPNQLRWNPLPLPDAATPLTFVTGLQTMAGTGSPQTKSGLCIQMYTANKSMEGEAMYNSDGDYLIVPQQGTLVITTEMGVLEVPPRHICVIPRGIVFSVAVSEASRGYILELFKGHFELPDLGPIGSNGLANPRDFEAPVAAYDAENGVSKTWKLFNKFGGSLFTTTRTGTPFNVVAWHGNYVPYRYDLEKFCCMNSVTFDHPDPSIYTVLTAKSDDPGTASCDFVIFPPRWMVMENTFRPPWYHRNCMSEFMGMVYGKYDAKEGFQAGGASLHSCMTPHGPDAATFHGASNAELKPHKFDGGLAFMFETNVMLNIAKTALDAEHRDKEYFKCWEGIPRNFERELAEMEKK
jgi:homogentisate 1,2-dioxygenase